MVEKVFPNTETYVIAFEAGASGNFINTLLFQFLYGQLPYRNSEFGKSHHSYGLLKNYLEIRRLSLIKSDQRPYDHSLPAEFAVNILPYNYLVYDPKDVTKPFITLEHIVPDWDALFTKFPNGKCIMITVPEELGPRVGGNVFYKTIIDEYETNKWYKERWVRYKVENPELQKYQHPQEVPIDEIELVTKRYKPQIPYVDVPEKYTRNVFIMTLKELLYEKEKVLNLLHTVCGKPITKFHHRYYDSYLQKQKDLVEKYMPWVTV